MSSSRGTRGRRGGHEEEHENHERWLVTYADMVTLLMVLFIVMFAMSQVDERKFNELKAGLAAGFGASDSLLPGSSSILDQPGTAAVDVPAPDLQFLPPASDSTHEAVVVQAAVRKAVSAAVSRAEQQRQQRAWAEARAEKDRLDGVLRTLRRALRQQGLEGDVSTTYDERGLVVSLVSRHVVFRANLATLSDRGRRVVDALGPVLRDLPDDLEVDGHTNQVKVKPKYFASDWDLSSARAITVLRHLEQRWGVPDRRLDRGGLRPHQAARRPVGARLAAGQQARGHRRAHRPARHQRRHARRSSPPPTPAPPDGPPSPPPAGPPTTRPPRPRPAPGPPPPPRSPEMTTTALPPDATDTEEAAAPGGRKRLLLVVVVVLLLVGGAAWWFVLRPSGSAEEPPPEPGEVVIAGADPAQPRGRPLPPHRHRPAGHGRGSAHGEVDGSKALDATISTFSGLALEEVQRPKEREHLREELMAELEELYHGEVMDVYFTEFVTQ